MNAVVKATTMFFDKAAVRKYMTDETRKALGYAGGYIRKVAQKSMKNAPRGAYSSPGKPPYSHGEGFLKKFLYYRWDSNTKSVVIGPVGFSDGSSGIPHLQEFGGTVTYRYKRGRNKGKSIPARFPARPYMGPALAASLDKIPEAFRGSVRGD